MNQICKNCSAGFEIIEEDFAFYDKVSPVFAGKKYQIPPPALCPECRFLTRISFRNERVFYQRACDACHKNIVSVHDPKHTPNVYCHACWWGDGWDPLRFGRDFDFSKPFFPQYKELLLNTPKLTMQNDNTVGSENCEYTNDFAYGKNAYLVIGSWHAQDCLYGFQTNFVKDCVDNYRVNDSELMYQSVFCEHSYGCQECMQCQECSDCIFGYDLKNCKNCILSAGLRNKQYYIWNKPYSKEDFLKKKKELRLDSWDSRERLRKEFEKFLVNVPRKFANLTNCEDCTGDHLLNSKNSHECYEYRNLHGCKWMSAGDGARDCYECYSTGGPELCYQCITPDNSYRSAFSVYCWKSQNVWYSENCHSSHDLFGCVSIKRREFCILNKKYEKETYEKLMARIADHMTQTGEWGEFFPVSVTPFAYNETIAQEWFPQDKASALRAGYRWQDSLPGTFGKHTISWEEVPDSIDDLENQGVLRTGKKVWEEIFPCLACGKSFKILETEYAFYKKLEIPLPRHCVDCRHYARKKRINPQKLWMRACMQCGIHIQTTYAPERPEKVLCEICYLVEVY